MIIAIDFDGTIAEYIPFDSPEGGKGKYGKPCDGVVLALTTLDNLGHEIIIWSCRNSDEYKQMYTYLEKHNIPFSRIANGTSIVHNPRKLNADVYIDDKAIRFNGEWNGLFLDRILKLKPWWKKETKKEYKKRKDKRVHHNKHGEYVSEPLHDLAGDEYIEKKKKVHAEMRDAADLFQKKNEDYSSSYKRTGAIMAMIYPNGIFLKTAEQFNQFNVLSIMIGKIVRYTNIKSSDLINHESVDDTLTDLGIYAFMLKDLQD